jgi:hypothetical protein
MLYRRLHIYIVTSDHLQYGDKSNYQQRRTLEAEQKKNVIADLKWLTTRKHFLDLRSRPTKADH